MELCLHVLIMELACRAPGPTLFQYGPYKLRQARGWGGGGWFCFTCPNGFSSFFFLPKKGGGGGVQRGA